MLVSLQSIEHKVLVNQRTPGTHHPSAEQLTPSALLRILGHLLSLKKKKHCPWILSLRIFPTDEGVTSTATITLYNTPALTIQKVFPTVQFAELRHSKCTPYFEMVSEEVLKLEIL